MTFFGFFAIFRRMSAEIEKKDIKSQIAEKEEKILEFWNKEKIFQQTLDKKSPKGEYVFYDGPPFATGTPHYGHLLAGTIKDVIPRYKTMCGFHVRRQWGWDTHGLPVENLVEKEFGLKNKKDIEDFGVKKFNEAARASVLRYAEDWKKVVPRMGRFIDMENDYRTMNSSYMETVMWIFKQLHSKGLVYEGFKSMHLCPHCGTTLSNFEVAQGYKDITDISATAKFELIDEPGTFFLAWTTTPWTLPGNVALAVNPDIDYVKIKVGEVFYILAEKRLSVIKDTYEIVNKVQGSELIGKSYKPLFDYYTKAQPPIENIGNGYKVYPAEFVTTEDGTGIVHIAPAFGEDDLKLGQKFKLPFIQHVSFDGKMKPEVTDFAGLMVKPATKEGEKDSQQKTDIEVIKYLAGKGTLFAKEKFIHSYPHCWRCETPLLNYATSSWFVEVTKIKDQLVKINSKIGWVPPEIGDGRFGKWLEGARDWAISRSRYWGAPLPIWRCADCEKTEVFGSIKEIKEKIGAKNKYFVARHGQAENNVLGILSCDPKRPHHLTELGKKQVKNNADSLKKKGVKIDLIIYSPFVRTEETAEIFAKELDVNKESMIEDNRLHEVNAGILDMHSDAEYQAFFGTREEKFYKVPEGGESHTDVKNRMTSVLYDLHEKYSGKNILLVTHNTPAWLMFAGAEGDTPEKAIELRHEAHDFIKNTEIKDLEFVPLPHNDNYELDFHRPYIDEVNIPCQCGGTMKRVKEVFDCWFESGSMPYAQYHYPFENLDKFNPEKGIGFPAEFIGEGLDQTRGWFYSMLIIAVGLFEQTSYKNVIVNGIILGEDGQKMSKRLKNYPDPMYVVSKYGADALRYSLLASPVVKAEDMIFSEKGVDEVVKKLIMRLNNVYTFYETYKSEEEKIANPKSRNVLDVWIAVRLKELAVTVSSALDRYELDKASRPFADFIDDLSTWYLRRSRDRFKSDDLKDKKLAVETSRWVLFETAKVLAPFMPFLAESLWQNLKTSKDEVSVHLTNWTEFVELTKDEKDILTQMAEVRKAVSLGLEARAKSQIKVRQPLSKLTLKDKSLANEKELIDLIIAEVNVKEVNFDEKIPEAVILNTEITPELKAEGMFRDLVRAVQDLRKTKGLAVGEEAILTIGTDNTGRQFVEKNLTELSKVASLTKVEFKEKGEMEVIAIEDLIFELNLMKN
ncbi:MAG: class I tRNA ligase family protein [Minisyncoccia bacterium]